MFIGHLGLAFVGKKIKNPPSLAIMFVAVQLLDLLWPILVLLGIETFTIEPGNTVLTPLNFTFYPYSHSLLMSVVWSILFSIIYYVFTKNRNNSIFLGLLVFSHWVLDFITHRPDLPLSPFSNIKLGLGLWNSPILEIILETGIFLIGIFIYVKHVTIKRKMAFWLLVIFFLLVHFLNLFGPPPPSTIAVAWSANLMWIIVLWAWWLEKK